MAMWVRRYVVPKKGKGGGYLLDGTLYSSRIHSFVRVAPHTLRRWQHTDFAWIGRLTDFPSLIALGIQTDLPGGRRVEFDDAITDCPNLAVLVCDEMGGPRRAGDRLRVLSSAWLPFRPDPDQLHAMYSRLRYLEFSSPSAYLFTKNLGACGSLEVLASVVVNRREVRNMVAFPRPLVIYSNPLAAVRGELERAGHVIKPYGDRPQLLQWDRPDPAVEALL